MKVVRAYKIHLYGNPGKVDAARYTQMRFNQYCNMFLGRIFFGEQAISTRGLGDLASMALYRSRGVIRALRASTKKLKIKANVPYVTKAGCYAKLEYSKTPSFDFWIAVHNLWGNKVRLPAKSHKALNRAIKQGWKLGTLCDFRMVNGNPYAIVYVSKAAPKIAAPKTTIGCDVGYKYSVCTSDGHVGRNLSKIIRRSKQITSERRRQKHKVSSKVKTAVKQLLDSEAKKVLRRSQAVSARLVVESPKRLANLRSGRLQGWARSYFANRLRILGQENGIEVGGVNPYQTSITCSECGAIDKESRADRDAFKCVSCGHAEHADINAAKVIARKGTQMLAEKSAVRMRKFSETEREVIK